MTFKRKEPEIEDHGNAERNLDGAAPVVRTQSATAGAIDTEKVTNIKSVECSPPCAVEPAKELAKDESLSEKQPVFHSGEINPNMSAFEASQRVLENQRRLYPADMLTNAAQTSVLNLPDEVRKNIIGFEDMEMDEMLTRILAAHTAAISCDRIMQLLWTTYQRSPDRAKVLTRLRHMAKHKQIVKGNGRSMFQAIHSKLEGCAQA